MNMYKLFEYYCPVCKKLCDFDEEIELRESQYEGDWKEYHIVCNSKVTTVLKVKNMP